MYLHFIFAVDIISAIEFDKSGDHLATGDRGGRVVLFERSDTKEVCARVHCIFLEILFMLCCSRIVLRFVLIISAYPLSLFCYFDIFYILQNGGSRRDLEKIDYPTSRHPEFRYKTEFQSHEPEVSFELFIMFIY